MHKYIFAIFFACSAITVSGCSGATNPVTAANTVGMSETGSPPEISLSGGSGRYLWGYWKVSIPADHHSIEAVPVRSMEMHLNAVGIIENLAEKQYLAFDYIFDSNESWISIDLTHPFSDIPVLSCFDVRGIFIFDSNYTFPVSGRSVNVGVEQPFLPEADGYTQLYNPVEYPDLPSNPNFLEYIEGKLSGSGDFDSTLNPFLAFHKKYPRNIFNPGDHETLISEIVLPIGPVTFGYALDVSWAPPSTPVTDPLIDFPPNANCPEPYEMRLMENVGLTEMKEDYLKLNYTISDHQGIDTIAKVTIEAPAIFTGTRELSLSEQISDTSGIYSITIANDKAAISGAYPILVRAAGTDIDPSLGPIDAWNVNELHVYSYPVAVGIMIPEIQNTGSTVHFISDSYDPDDGSECKASWDIYNDGIIDGFHDMYMSFTEPGNIKVQLWAEDDEGRIDCLDDPLILTIKEPAGWAVEWQSFNTASSITSVAVDQFGNIYVAGYFTSYIDADPGTGIFTLGTTNSADRDSFILKMNSNREFIWAKHITGPDEATVRSIVLDKYSAVYVAGTSSHETDFDPDAAPGIYDFGSGGSWVAKYSPNGTFEWFQPLSENNGLAVAPELFASDSLYTAVSMNESIIAKKILLNGGVQWTRSITALDSINNYALSAGDGLVHLAGDFSGTVDFDPGPGIDEYSGDQAGYHLMLNESGNYLGVEILGGNGSSTFSGMDIDDAGNRYFCGAFEESCDFDFSAGTHLLTASGDQDPFIAGYTSSGNLLWVQSWDLMNSLAPEQIRLTSENIIQVRGNFTADADFDPGPGESHPGPKGAYLTTYDSSGNFLRALAWELLINSIDGMGIGIDDEVLMVGHGTYQTDYDPTPATYYNFPHTYNMFLFMTPADGKW
ncbi:MAG TPA: hypothetical protein VGB30_07275 [bacterium]|jgi:hypothetical protein